MEVDLTHVDLGIVIDAVEFPFVGGIGLLQDVNRAVGRDGKDVIGGVLDLAIENDDYRI